MTKELANNILLSAIQDFNTQDNNYIQPEELLSENTCVFYTSNYLFITLFGQCYVFNQKILLTLDDFINEKTKYIINNNFFIKDNNFIYLKNNSSNELIIYRFINDNEKIITLSDNIRYINDHIFDDCNIEFFYGNNIKYIKTYVFCDCYKLNQVYIPKCNVIDDSAFFGCTSLSNINKMENLEKIGRKAFLNCQSISSFYVTSSLTSIEYGAFNNCINLTSINLEESNIKELYSETFKNCISLSSISLPKSLDSIYADCFNNCKNLKIIDMCNINKFVNLNITENYCNPNLSILISKDLSSIYENGYKNIYELNFFKKHFYFI